MSNEHARNSLEFLWGRLARPLNVEPAVAALLGLPQAVTRQFVGATTATSPPAEKLLDRMPRLLRSLSISTATTSIRCVGEVRGPVLWSETIAARSATAGDPGLFLCTTPTRVYDTADNQVLVAALDVIVQSAADVERGGTRFGGEELIKRARTNGSRAQRYLDHRSLSSVARGRPPSRVIQRARSGRRPSFRPAMDVLTSAAEPVEVEHLLPFCDDQTVAQHDLLVAVIRALEARGVKLPPFHVDADRMHAGPLSYRHPQDRYPDERGGTRVGQVVFDVPTAGADADADDGLSHHCVRGRSDLARGIDEALTTF